LFESSASEEDELPAGKEELLLSPFPKISSAGSSEELLPFPFPRIASADSTDVQENSKPIAKTETAKPKTFFINAPLLN
jgi:hypothetical protein